MPLTELIETLWNVNKIKTLERLAQGLELIETLWNVNSTYIGTYVDFTGINRNIVECKCG